MKCLQHCISVTLNHNVSRAHSTMLVDSASDADVESKEETLFTHCSIVHEFLTGLKLRKVFAHLCNHSAGQSVDPISDVAYIMLTCPVQMMVSEVSGEYHMFGRNTCVSLY